VAEKKPRKTKVKVVEEIVEPVETIEPTEEIVVTAKTHNELMSEKRDNIINKLRSGVLSIEFRKADGSSRTMNATLNPQLVPPKQFANESIERLSQSQDLVVVWDLDINGWRSFKISTLTRVNNQLI